MCSPVPGPVDTKGLWEASWAFLAPARLGKDSVIPYCFSLLPPQAPLSFSLLPSSDTCQSPEVGSCLEVNVNRSRGHLSPHPPPPCLFSGGTKVSLGCSLGSNRENIRWGPAVFPLAGGRLKSRWLLSVHRAGQVLYGHCLRCVPPISPARETSLSTLYGEGSQGTEWSVHLSKRHGAGTLTPEPVPVNAGCTGLSSQLQG